MGIVLYDDQIARGFEPFALTRPAGELRAGGEIIRRRWTRVLGTPALGFIGAPHLAAFDEFDSPSAATGILDTGVWIVNARCAPALGSAVPSDAQVIRVADRVAAIRLTSPMAVEAFASGQATLELLAGSRASVVLDGWWLDAVWDLIRHLSPMLASDAIALAPDRAEVPAQLTVLGSHRVHVDMAAHVEPFVVVDATAGPVLIRRGATVQAFTRLVGPCIIGEDAIVSGGRVAASSIGEHVKVNGEMNSTIMIGHCNKGHEGFVGHSVIGRWANLGADTVTSNLKNSYGAISLWTPRGVEVTGLQFLGSLIGDHVKTGIGTRLPTGCVLGAGANLFGSAMPPKAVPPFAWGEAPAWAQFVFDKFLQVAERVMARRDVALSPRMRECLRAAHAARWTV